MKIEINVYKKIVFSIPDTLPETGGIIGGKDGVITAVEFDCGTQIGKKCSYSPSVEYLNAVLKDWKEKDITFYGIFHTHYFGVETLSAGDKEYIMKIMNSMPETITKLYFPLVVMPQRKMIAYAAVKEKGQLKILKEKIYFKEEQENEE